MKHIGCYGKWYENPEKDQITSDMWKSAKRRGEYFLTGASLPLLSAEGKVSCFVTYAGYTRSFLVPIKEVCNNLPGYQKYIHSIWKKKGESSYHPEFFMLVMGRILILNNKCVSFFFF